MYDAMEPVVRAEVDAYENRMMTEVRNMDEQLVKIFNGSGKRPGRPMAVRRAVRKLTRFSVDKAMDQFRHWVELEEMLTVKFIDGNVKAQDANGEFLHSKYSSGIPDGLTQPGYTDKWKQAVAADNGKVLEVK